MKPKQTLLDILHYFPLICAVNLVTDTNTRLMIELFLIMLNVIEHNPPSLPQKKIKSSLKVQVNTKKLN